MHAADKPGGLAADAHVRQTASIMKNLALFIFLLISGCNIGHPTKAKDSIGPNELIGKYQYRNEFTIVLEKNGIGYQLFESKKIRFDWSIKDNVLIFDKLRGRFNDKIKGYGKQEYIISNDYREYYYPFGSPYDFDNHEVWNRLHD